MTVSMRWWLAVVSLLTGAAMSQSKWKDPHIGYAYPDGGRCGTTVEVLIGGQGLGGAAEVCVSGTGVTGKVIQFYRPIFNLKAEQREAIQKRLREVTQQRLAETPGAMRYPAPAGDKSFRGKKAAGKFPATTRKSATSQASDADLPAHPLLRNLEDKSLRELMHVRSELLNIRKKQPNAQIAESVLVEITIDPKAPPGDREIRIKTPQGLTNPIAFQVGAVPEICELECIDVPPFITLPEAPSLTLPVIINGQIKPGDVDRFRFTAKRGQKLVIESWARRLVPYLADAVPGWFQATLTVYDAKGKEVAFADDYVFDPDPVLFFEVPQDGIYELEIRDSIYRGREDFVYRIAVGEQPFITQMHPLGGRRGTKTLASIDGWNLANNQLLLGTSATGETVRQTATRESGQLSNRVTYAVDALPECNDVESNNTASDAQQITLPTIVNGTLSPAADVDVFRFEARKGDTIVAEVYARRLASPLDSLLRLTDASGKVLAWNDDCEDLESGLITHHADSYLRTRLTESGTYYVQLSDSQHHGGPAYGYRLRISTPRPDFTLRMTPSSINIRPGSAAPFYVYASRKDGYDGDIDVVVKSGPECLRISGGRIPKGRDRVRMTLTAAGPALSKPATIELEGRALIRGTTIRRPVVPCEDMMQAFIYRHLVPSQQLMVATVGSGRPGQPIELMDDLPVRLVPGGTAKVRIQAPKGPVLRTAQFELSDPPKGVTIESVTPSFAGLTMVLKAAKDDPKVGFVDNLIVEAYAPAPAGKQPGKGQAQRVPLGVLPAIPIEIVPR